MRIINNITTMTTEIICESFMDNEHLFTLIEKGIVDLHGDKITLYSIKEYKEWIDYGMPTEAEGYAVTEEEEARTEVDGMAILDEDDITTVDECPHRA